MKPELTLVARTILRRNRLRWRSGASGNDFCHRQRRAVMELRAIFTSAQASRCSSSLRGPLDLLLYLIRAVISPSSTFPLRRSRQYVQYIGVMQELQLELAGDIW